MGNLMNQIIAKPTLDEQPLKQSARLVAGALQPTMPFMEDRNELNARHADRLRFCRKHRIPPHEAEVIEAMTRHASEGGRNHLERALAVIKELLQDEYETHEAP